MPNLYDHYLIEDHELVTETLTTLHETSIKVLTMSTSADFDKAPALEVQLHNALATLQALHQKKTQREEIERAESTRRHFF
ncbi:hypothetical protein [Terribacillus halophilus]|uniref:hypothetical protein n=1 Tax=Terribacillus halophilus TaxID=361279 RepID=UPI0039821802